ncbi:MAG TPA: diguanylate cyclase [Thermodesulfobacteriota bacterium]|nr:diguanylate cyclase [Thermodesulfobacteriota bacterium]
MSIGKKIILGFLLYGLITVLVALFALWSLDRVDEIGSSIVRQDIPVAEVANAMAENLGEQRIIAAAAGPGDREAHSLLLKKETELTGLLEKLKSLPAAPKAAVEKFASLCGERRNQWILLAEKESGEAQGIKANREEALRIAREISRSSREDQNKKAGLIAEVGKRAYRVTLGLCVAGVLLGIGAAIMMTRNILAPMGQLRLWTAEISQGRFDPPPGIRDWDELGELSKSFREMAVRLKELEAMYLDANPLTRLPGGVAIEQVLKTRLAEGAPLAFALVDLRNFKAFNDRYGYARGNEVILVTMEIIRAAVKAHGREGDFVGHIGGDDFVFMTSPADYESICDQIVKNFDRRIVEFYDAEDRARGCIQGKNRRGDQVSFPIMTIMIAVVTNRQRTLKSHIQVGEIAAEMKTFAKSFQKSIYVVDKRRDPKGEGKPGPPAA